METRTKTRGLLISYFDPYPNVLYIGLAGGDAVVQKVKHRREPPKSRATELFRVPRISLQSSLKTNSLRRTLNRPQRPCEKPETLKPPHKSCQAVPSVNAEGEGFGAGPN